MSSEKIMKNYGLFDVIGTIMIGPSSSHTAGAFRLGIISKIIYARDIKKVFFHLHGSFKNTYQG
ncbi:L-serine ammonia-lyase, iron-sulfur-dependent, subunit beta, partial [Parvimonas micra]|nr:L-serine ammonia-lyase, iron-sulfur-dependent, subunit beta [Parvimonas micra]